MSKTLRSRPLLADVVRVGLREAIVRGEFPPGSKLPNEDELRERFDVSRITLREAVRGLIEDGYVVRRQGSGTYITYRPALRNSLDTNFSYSEYIESAGSTASKRILSAKLVPADAETAEDLQVEARSEVVELRRLRVADERPAIFSIDFLPPGIVDVECDLPTFRGSLYRLLSERRRPVEHGEAIITPVIADKRLAHLLEIAEGSPLQYIEQVDFDSAGVPVLRSLEWHVPSVIELRVYRRGPGPIAAAEERAAESG